MKDRTKRHDICVAIEKGLAHIKKQKYTNPFDQSIVIKRFIQENDFKIIRSRKTD